MHSPAADILAKDVCGISDAFAGGSLAPVDVLRVYFDHIEQYNPRLNAFLSLRFDAAMEEARAAAGRWKSGQQRSPIDGVPFGVKANIAVKGLPWHGGIAAYRDRMAEEDAGVVERLRGAGAVPMGILNMHEGALGATTDNPSFGRCYNPWGDGLTPGGSSGGSGAAVAAGFCAFSLGTDTMGSVRIPSAYCGIAGLKPSYGDICGRGLVELSRTLDHIGPHALSARDLKMIYAALRKDDSAPPARSLRIGIGDWRGGVDVSPDVAAAFKKAAQELSKIGEVSIIDLSKFDFGALRRRGLLVSEVEGYRTHKQRLAQSPGGFSDDFRGLLEWGAGQSQEKIDAAYAEVKSAGAALNALFDEVDVITIPTAPQGPFGFDDQIPANQADFTCIANFAGAPAVATPASVDGAPPASLQFIAKTGADAVALEAAIAFEAMRGPAPRPPLVADIISSES